MKIPMPPMDSGIYVIKSESRKLVVFGMGNGNSSTLTRQSDLTLYSSGSFSSLAPGTAPLFLDALKSADVDAANIKRVTEGADCLNIPNFSGDRVLAPVEISFVIPHSHADHVNGQMVHAVTKLGARVNKVFYHEADKTALHCTSPYCGFWNEGMDPSLKFQMPISLFGFAPFRDSLTVVSVEKKQAIVDRQLDGSCEEPLWTFPYNGTNQGIQIFRSSTPRQAKEDGIPWTTDIIYEKEDSGLNPPFHTPGALTVYLPFESFYDDSQQCDGLKCQGLTFLSGPPNEQNCFWPSRSFYDSEGRNITRRRGANGDAAKAPYSHARTFGQHVVYDTPTK